MSSRLQQLGQNPAIPQEAHGAISRKRTRNSRFFKILLVQKFFCLQPKKFGSEKNVKSKKFFCPQSFVWSKNIFGLKKFLGSKKYLGPNIFFRSQNFLGAMLFQVKDMI